jgi:hypothetical protein
MPARRKQVFVSYSRADKPWLERLRPHLSALEREGEIHLWVDNLLLPGQEWQSEVRRAIDKADVAIILTSADYFSSEFIHAHELPALLEANRAGCRLLVVKVRDYELSHTVVGRLQVVNPRPLDSMRKNNYEKVFQTVAEEIRNTGTRGPGDRQPIRVELVCGNVLTVPADVLGLKFARYFYGADRMVFEAMRDAGISVAPLPEPGEALLLDTRDSVTPGKVLFLGVRELRSFGYRQIREFGEQVLAMLASRAPETATLTLTVHGPGYGLDEAEAFRSEIAGLIDALSSGSYPPALQSITIVERERPRVDALQRVLDELVPDGIIEADRAKYLTRLTAPARENLRSAGYESASKPHVFVAMPFHKGMIDTFRYGIEKPVNDAGFLCERADFAVFAGDVLQWMKERIASAELVIADLTGANPNVYLEVGYAWGVKKRTVLLVNADDELKFDVQSQRCLKYETISDLEEKLRKELSGLA